MKLFNLAQDKSGSNAITILKLIVAIYASEIVNKVSFAWDEHCGGADNMANIFKDYYELNCTVLLANIIKEVWPEFNENGFVVILKNELAEKEFL